MLTARRSTAIPRFADVPLNLLLSAVYNDARRKLVGQDASLELRPGVINGRTPWVDHDAAARASLLPGAPGAGEPTVARLGVIGADTCHIDVIDRDGNMVSATPSGGWLQSSPVIPELGFPMGTRGQMFWLKPDLPNSLAPGKRPRTTLSPSFALRDGKPWMAFGTPGGDQQDQWSLLFFLRMVHHNMNIQEAIDAPAFHSEHWPSSFWPRVARPGRLVLEGGYDDAVVSDLTRRGHKAEKGAVMVGRPAVRRPYRGWADSAPGPIRAACRATRSAADAPPPPAGSRADGTDRKHCGAWACARVHA